MTDSFTLEERSIINTFNTELPTSEPNARRVTDYLTEIDRTQAEINETVDPASLGRRNIPFPAADTTEVLDQTSNPNRLQESSELASVIDIMELENSEEGPARRNDDSARGTPIDSNDRNAANIRASIAQKGRARISTLTDLFGRDALVLGSILFRVPPLAIRIKKGNIVYRWKPLRTKESIAVKSGNGECYIEIDLAFVGLNQIQNSLAELITIWKKVPFCFIENTHIRKMMIPNKPDESMAVCLETLVMDAISGNPRTVYATLITSWFNYKPYSQNFWFRRDWKPAGDDSPIRRNSGSDPANEEGSVNLVVPANDTNSIIQDLSAIENPNLREELPSYLPPEIKLFEKEQSVDPADPSIAGTFPVVYPFNSKPFMDYLTTGSDRAVRINSWNDGLILNWNSFVKTRVPNNWQYSAHRTTERSVASSRSRDRARETEPVPIEGKRNTIIFIGDTWMTNLLGLASNTKCKAPSEGGQDYSIPTFFSWSGNQRFSSINEYRYFAMCRNGATSETLLNWWNNKKTDAELKDGDEGEVCSKLAGVVIHAGLFDGDSGPNTSALRTIMNEVSQYGGIPVLLPLPPVGDAVLLSPERQSQLRLLWGNSSFEGYQTLLPDYHARMVQMADSVENSQFLDYHDAIVPEQARNNRAAAPGSDYQTVITSPAGYYSIYWNDAGFNTCANYVYREIPWTTTERGTDAQDSNLWTVCEVEDGDTIWVWGNHPETGDRVLRNVRLKFVDTPETYHDYRDTRYNSSGIYPMHHGQDSYRPTESRYGEIATNALRRKLGVPQTGTSNAQVRIEWFGTGYYGRHLAVVYVGEENVNLWLVREGYGFAMPSDNGDESQPYVFAELEAKGRGDVPSSPRGIWAQRRVELEMVPDGFPDSLKDNLRTLMHPSDFRTAYPSSSDGGHSGRPSRCPDVTTDTASASGTDGDA